MNSDFASTSPENLLRAFTNTDYRATVGRRAFVIHPGRCHADLDAALGDRQWAIVTACNPQARRIDDADNRERHQRLLEATRRRNRESHPAVNRDPYGHWPDEHALLIVGEDIAIIDELAETFGQAATVTGRSGEPAQLRLYGTRWPETLPDWASRVN